MKNSIKEIFEKHLGKVTDKWSLYLDEWDRLFAPYRDYPIRFLEIGIQNGGSLEIWGKYFSKAERIVGCDIDPKCGELQFDDDRIAVVVGDVNSDSCERNILEKSPIFDVIIDDGSHQSSDIICSFARLFPHLNNGGEYIVEDLHCSYWSDFGGGLHNPFSAIAFFKRLADIVNYEHWRNNKSSASLLTEYAKKFHIAFSEADLLNIHSVELLNSLCIIKKLPYEKNVLGKRIVVGIEESVTNGATAINGSGIQDHIPTISEDENLNVFTLIERNDQLRETINLNNQAIQSLKEKIAKNERKTCVLDSKLLESNQKIHELTIQLSEEDQRMNGLISQLATAEQMVQELNVKLVEKENDILFYALSKSWSITRPLRKINKFIKRGKNV